jgi:FkbM family methyltransferase
MASASIPSAHAAFLQHHPAIRAFTPAVAYQPAEFDLDFLGARTRRSFYAGMPQADRTTEPRLVTTSYPAFDEEYFEWIDLLETLEQASDTYVIVELGAGYGRWCMRAAAAARTKPGCRVQCVAVEAEPDHFRWLVQHFRDNGVNPDDHDLIWGAVGASPGVVPFRVGKANGWYGQRIASRAHGSNPPGVLARRRLKARSALARPPRVDDTATVMWVPCVTLHEVLAQYPRVDLIDMDVQGAEFDVISAGMEVLSDRVRRIHIGTHGPQIEERIRELFSEHGWTNVFDYPCGRQVSTTYGEIPFGDGVQTWVNPDVGRSRSRSRARTIERLRDRNRALRAETAALRTRCRVLQERVTRLSGGRTLRSLVRGWLSRARARTSFARRRT